jgi:hypothetical protein
MSKRFADPQRFRKLVVLLAFALLLPVAQASVLSGGGSVAPSPLFPGGTLVATTSGTITTPTFSTDFTQWVFADPLNSWCVNCLDFVYQFTNNGPDVNERYSMSSYGGFQADVGTFLFGGLHDPNTVNRSSLFNGAVIGFNYNPGSEIVPGVTTPWLVIETDAKAYKWGFVSAQDGTAGSARAYVPAVPEPASLGLLGTGILLAGGAFRRFGLRK